MFSKRSRILLIEIFAILVIGVMMVGSSSKIWAEAKFHDEFYFFKRQFVFAIIGFIVMYLASKISLLKIRKYAKSIFFICTIKNELLIYSPLIQ